MRSAAIHLLCALLAPASALAQFPTDRAENLRVLPEDISMDSLRSVMGGFTRALGVRCSYCHVQREGQTFEQMDFSLDENPRKDKARAMLRMVAAINGEHLSRLEERREPEIRVAYFTCHRGVAEPRPLQQILLTAYTASGADSMQAAYHALRERYYGRSSYDFGEVPLADVASSVVERGDSAGALRIHQLNVEMNPRSAFALRQLAAAHLALRDTAAAVASLQRALGINPDDGQARRALERLGRAP